VVLGQSVFAANAGLAFVFFIAFSLMTVLGVRFAAYAFWNRQDTDIQSQEQLWEYLVLVGIAAAVYGLLGGVETATAVTDVSAVIATPYRDGFLLAFLFLLALTGREIHDTDATRGRAFATGVRRSVEMGFGLVVTASVLGTGVFGTTDWLLAGKAGIATGIAGHGLVHSRRQLSRTDVRGTMLDSLLRHLVPIVVFASLVLIVDVAVLFAVPVAVVRHVQAVFVIMTATTLMTATIKLRQNVAGP